MSRNYISQALRSFPSLDPKRENSFYSHMFQEDLSLGILPIGGRCSTHPKFSVILEGENQSIPYVKKLLNSLGQYNNHDTMRIVCDAVNSIASHLVTTGICHFEIVKDTTILEQYYLLPFTSRRLLKISNIYCQFVPRGDWKLHEKKLNLIHSRQVWRISFPKVLDGMLKYKNKKKKLASFDPLRPGFWKYNLEGSSSFDFNHYVKSEEVYIQRLTRNYGWDKRSDKNKTEFYSIYQKIRMQRSKAIISEHIVTQLNLLISRLGYDCIIKILGIPSVQDIIEIENKFIAGSISFDDAINTVLVY